MSPFISFSDSNCFGLSGATDEAEEFSDPWLPPNDLRSDPRLSRSPGKLVFSPISSASASVRLDFLLKPGVSMPSKFKNHNIKRDHNVAKDKFHREQGLLKAKKKKHKIVQDYTKGHSKDCMQCTTIWVDECAHNVYNPNCTVERGLTIETTD